MYFSIWRLWGEEVSASPYVNTSGFVFNNFLSSGFTRNLVLIFPPPFHQQARKKVALLVGELFKLIDIFWFNWKLLVNSLLLCLYCPGISLVSTLRSTENATSFQACGRNRGLPIFLCGFMVFPATVPVDIGFHATFFKGCQQNIVSEEGFVPGLIGCLQFDEAIWDHVAVCPGIGTDAL